MDDRCPPVPHNSTVFDHWGRYAVLMWVFFIPLSTALTTVSMILILVFWGLGKNYSTKLKYFFANRVSIAALLIVGLYVLGIGLERTNSPKLLDGLTDVLRLLYIPFIMYFFRQSQLRQWAIWAFIGAMVVTLCLSWLKLYAHLPIGEKYAGASVFKNHITTNFFMAVAAFFLAHQLIRSTYRPWFLWGLLGCMVFYVLFLSFGRTGYILLVILMGFWGIHTLGKTGWIIVPLSLLGLLGAAYLGSDAFQTRVDLVVQDIEIYRQGGPAIVSSIGARLEFLATGIELVKHYPILGWGSGSFSEIYAQRATELGQLVTDNPHNEYLRFAVEFGLLGLLALLGLFFQQFRSLKQLPVETQPLARALLWAFVLGCFAHSWILDFTEGYFFTWFAAMFYAPITQTWSAQQPTQLRLNPANG